MKSLVGFLGRIGEIAFGVLSFDDLEGIFERPELFVGNALGRKCNRLCLQDPSRLQDLEGPRTLVQ